MLQSLMTALCLHGHELRIHLYKTIMMQKIQPFREEDVMTGLLFNLSGARPRCVVSVGLVGWSASSTNKTLWDLDFTLAILSGRNLLTVFKVVIFTQKAFVWFGSQ